MGETCVPLDSLRVVTLCDIGNALALGIKPVGSHIPQDVHSYLNGKLAGITDIGILGEANLEIIVSLKPDVILAEYPYQKGIYHLLKQIAPTVMVEMQGSKDWKKYFMKQAEALGKLDKAEQLMAEYYAKLKKLMDEMGGRLQQMTVSVIRVTESGVAPYLSDTFCSVILQDAGLNLIPEPGSGNSWLISKENISDLDADVIFMWTYGYQTAIAENARTALEKLKTDPLWLKLNAVQKSNIYEVPSYWIGSSILAANAVIDDLFKYLVQNQ
jgi:iron complex transport system substrate-binding protein